MKSEEEEKKKNVGGFLPTSAKCSVNSPSAIIHKYFTFQSARPGAKIYLTQSGVLRIKIEFSYEFLRIYIRVS